ERAQEDHAHQDRLAPAGGAQGTGGGRLVSALSTVRVRRGAGLDGRPLPSRRAHVRRGEAGAGRGVGAVFRRGARAARGARRRSGAARAYSEAGRGAGSRQGERGRAACPQGVRCRGHAMTEVAQSLRQVRERLRAACSKAGRATDAVRLVAVSKKQPVEAIRAAFAEGQRDFGENYVQELAAKAAALSDLPGLCWHFIGHLQRNKAAQAVTLASLVQTVDSERLAIELGRRAEAQGRRLPVLVEVNVGGETQKS